MWCPNQDCEDALETGVPAEFREGIAICPLCGSLLVSYPPEWEKPPAANLEWVHCLTLGDNSLLPQVKAVLDSAEVRYFVKDDGVQHLIGLGTAALGFNPITGPPVLMVEADDLERAKVLLRDFVGANQDEPRIVPRPGASPAQSPSRCDECGKALEVGEGDEPLTYCYHCGSPLGSA